MNILIIFYLFMDEYCVPSGRIVSVSEWVKLNLKCDLVINSNPTMLWMRYINLKLISALAINEISHATTWNVKLTFCNFPQIDLSMLPRKYSLETKGG